MTPARSHYQLHGFIGWDKIDRSMLLPLIECHAITPSVFGRHSSWVHKVDKEDDGQ